MSSEYADTCADNGQAQDPRSVSRGSKLQVGFLGLDSLYLVIEYPNRDIYDFWVGGVDKLDDLKYSDGIEYKGRVLRRGLIGYKLSVWDDDARLLLTDRVADEVGDNGNGMGMMLQLGPKWLRRYGDGSIKNLKLNILGQLIAYAVNNPEQYPIRLNRLDIALDVLGLDTESFTIDTWRKHWVGYAKKKSFHISAENGELEGLTIGSSSGAIRFKVYDKVAESKKRGSSQFWRSVWNVDEEHDIKVARFEWSIKCFEANFAQIRYLNELNYEDILKLLNYASLQWGRLCIPQANDTNQTRWPLDPLWLEIRQLIRQWNFNFDDTAKREYDYRIDLKPEYLRSIAGWLAGLQVRVGLHTKKEEPASFSEAMYLLKEHGHSVDLIKKRADQKWRVASKLTGGQS